MRVCDAWIVIISIIFMLYYHYHYHYYNYHYILSLYFICCIYCLGEGAAGVAEEEALAALDDGGRQAELRENDGGRMVGGDA